MLIKDPFEDPINLYNAPVNMLMIPMANCQSCRHNAPLEKYHHCAFFKAKPGERCGQFNTREL
jgi:hypothetical protein